MRSLALTAALATALTGTGCYSSSYEPPPPTGSVHVYWAFERTAPAQPSGKIIYDATYDAPDAGGVCPESAVATVRVASAAGTFDIDCTGPSGGSWVQGAVVDPLLAGWNTITLTGYRTVAGLGSVPVYSSTFDVNVPAFGVATVYQDVLGLAAPLEAYADLASGLPPGLPYATCAEANSPNLTIDIYDYAGTPVDTFEAGCLGAMPALVYSELLDLDDYTVRMQGRTPGGALVLDACDQALAHFSSQTQGGAFSATLYTNPVPTCP